MLGLLLILISKSWGCPPLGPAMPFLDRDTCTEEGLFISARVFFPVWCHPWLDDRTDEWMDDRTDEWMDDKTDEWMDGKLHKKWPRRPFLYVISTTSVSPERIQY
jgi:hypothetical protein